MGEQLISGEIPSRLRGMERGSKQIPDTSFGWMRLLTRHSGGHRNRARGVDRRQLGAYLGRDVRVPDFGPPRGCGRTDLSGGLRVETYARFRTCLTVPPCFSIFCCRSMMA